MRNMDANDVREILNGIWAVSSLCVLILLMTFIWVKRIGSSEWQWRFRQRRWWTDGGVQLAGALWILIAGHFVRSFPQWIQFIMLNSDPLIDTKSTIYRIATLAFIPATVLVLAGKILCVWSISPGEWNSYIALTVLILSISLPLLVFMWM
jgi:hypothetical protein